MGKEKHKKLAIVFTGGTIAMKASTRKGSVSEMVVFIRRVSNE